MHFRQGAITVPGPETDVLVALADELQISMVVGVAERLEDAYYNTVLLIDPEGIYGIYRKLHLTPLDKLWATLVISACKPLILQRDVSGWQRAMMYSSLKHCACWLAKGADLVCAPAFLDFPSPLGLAPSHIKNVNQVDGDEFDALHHNHLAYTSG